ncbi:hypothetical protein OROHE_010852 [Orobanche hederae]
MMSVERSFEAWEEVQRHGQDLADRLAQGFTGLIQSHIAPPSFSWPNPSTPKLFDVEFPTKNFTKKGFGLSVDNSTINGVTAIFDIGNRIGQVGADIGTCLNGVVQQFFRHLPLPFRHDENVGISMRAADNGTRSNMGITLQEDLGSLEEQFKGYGFSGNSAAVIEGSTTNESIGVGENALKHMCRSKGTFNMTSTYDSRTRNVESSLVARGDLWRVETSQGSSTSGNENSSLFLVQLGPVLFVRDSTLLLPVHLSKQHLLWYGYDRKSFMDLQFPNGQVTYVSGEGVSTSAFMPFCGGLLQAQGQYPGEMKFSFSCKEMGNTHNTDVAVARQVSCPRTGTGIGLEEIWSHAEANFPIQLPCRTSRLLTLFLCPTLGGSCPGLRMELTHSVKEELNFICGCALVTHPSAFASVSKLAGPSGMEMSGAQE